MHLEEEIIWARVEEPVVVVAKAVVVVVIRVVLSVPADIVFVQNVARKCPISEE